MTAPHDPAIRNGLHSLSPQERQAFLDSSFDSLKKIKEELTDEHERKALDRFLNYLKSIYFQKSIPENWFFHMSQLYSRHSFFLTWLSTIPKPS
jgi:hypothetical protein